MLTFQLHQSHWRLSALLRASVTKSMPREWPELCPKQVTTCVACECEAEIIDEGAHFKACAFIKCISMR